MVLIHFSDCVYLVSELEADPPHISLLSGPGPHQPHHLLLGSQGPKLGAALRFAALLQQGHLLLAQEVVCRASCGRCHLRDGGWARGEQV